MGVSTCRSVCDKSQLQTPSVVSPVPDPKAYVVDAMSFPWKGMFAYAFPPFRFLSSSSEDFSRTMSNHSYSSSLAHTSLVSRSSWPIMCSSTGFTSKRQSSFPIQLQDSSSQSREATSVRVASLMVSFNKRGFPEGAARHLSRAVRDSTNIVYEWAIFCNWCSEKEVDPYHISVQQLSDFLIFLFEEICLSPSTSKGYRSAISRTIHLSGCPAMNLFIYWLRISVLNVQDRGF